MGTGELDIDLKAVLPSRFEMGELVGHINSSKALFAEAIKLCISNEKPHNWRAAWVLFHATADGDKRLTPHLNSLIRSIVGKTDGHQRELIKLISKGSLNDDQEGHMFDRCISIWEKVSNSPSSRYTAFKFIHRINQKYPELKGELDFLKQDHYLESLSPGVRRGIEKILQSK